MNLSGVKCFKTMGKAFLKGYHEVLAHCLEIRVQLEVHEGLFRELEKAGWNT